MSMNAHGELTVGVRDLAGVRDPFTTENHSVSILDANLPDSDECRIACVCRFYQGRRPVV